MVGREAPPPPTLPWQIQRTDSYYTKSQVVTNDQHETGVFPTLSSQQVIGSHQQSPPLNISYLPAGSQEPGLAGRLLRAGQEWLCERVTARPRQAIQGILGFLLTTIGRHGSSTSYHTLYGLLCPGLL